MVKKEWDLDRYVTLYREQHTIIKILADHDHSYSGIGNGTKACKFIQGFKISKLEAVISVVQAQPEKFDRDFDATVSYLNQMVMKKGTNMQAIHVAKTRSAKPQVTPLMGKI